MGYNPISDRIIFLKIQEWTFIFTILQVHTLMMDTKEEQLRILWNTKTKSCIKFLKKNVQIIIIGDINVKSKIKFGLKRVGKLGTHNS